MKAKVTKLFKGQPDYDLVPRDICVGEVITGDLARVAVEQDWADEISEAPAKVAKPAKKRGK